MKFLSLSRPWDWAIFDEVARKHIENRDWQPPVWMIGQQIALQSAKSWDDAAIVKFCKLGLEYPSRYDQYPWFVIRGVVTIERIVTSDRTLPDDQKRWFTGDFGWVLTEVRRFQSFVPCKGGQGLRNLPPSVEQQVMTQLQIAPRTVNT